MGWLILLAVALATAGCATTEVARPPIAAGPAMPVRELPADAEWRSVRFRLTWAEGAEPAWHLDALLADRVVRPVLEAQEDGIALWRFHRRAGRDHAGHQFSFLHYAPPRTAAVVRRAIEETPLVAALIAAGRLEAVTYDDTDPARRSDLAYTSDAAWPPEIQRTWPWFIMGVSAHWLRLLGEVRDDGPGSDDESPEALIARYAAVHEKVDLLWREHGQHVYLHHLNALYGYRPLVIRETTLKRF